MYIVYCVLWKTLELSQISLQQSFILFNFAITLLENLNDDDIALLYGTKFSTISLYLKKLYVT